MASHNILEEFVWQKRHKVFPVTTYNFCCLLIIVTEKDQCITFDNYFCRRQSCSFTVENFISIYSRNHVKLTSDYLEFNLAKNERWIIVEKKLKFEDNSHLHGYSSNWNTLAGLIPPHVCACRKPGSGLPMSHYVVFLCSMSEDETWLFSLLMFLEYLAITV